MKKPRKTSVILPLALVLALWGVPNLPPAAAQAQQPDITTMQNFLNLMDRYLDISGKWMNMLADKETTIYLAVEGIAEIYEQKGNKLDAIPALREIMKKYPQNRVVRTAIQFKIRDILKDNGKYDEALRVLWQIIEENAR